MGTALNVEAWSKTAASNDGADSSIGTVADSSAPTSVDNWVRGIMASVANYIDDIGGGLTAAGTANAHTVTTNRAISSGHLTDGLRLAYYAPAANTSTTVTVAVDGLTAKNIKRCDGSALTVGCIKSDMLLDLVYEAGVGEFRAVNLPALVGGAGLTLLTSGTVSSAATLDIVLSGYTGFRAIKFALSRFIPSTNNVALWMRFSTNGGSSYDAGASDYNYATYYNFSSDDSSSGDTKIIVIPVFSIFGISNDSSGGADMEITLFDHTSTARYSGILASGLPVFDSVGRQKVDSFGSRLTAQDTDAVRFLFSSGDIASGTYAVYGLP